MDRRSFHYGNILPIPDEADMPAFEIDPIIPIGGVKQHALILVEARNGGPLPVVQDARCVNEDVAMVGHGGVAGKVLDVYIIPSLFFIPKGAGDLMLCLDILV